ncbi:hypothetical protein PGT21_034501 [Puccinia graminis f. sp. tritici]|uniref:Uncharacterized protein n=1 Tax=Puccinia graminis f. sp. tritici TaxID=56615 RepID=A0A5B0N623_PUCGR|nr:hypothetical protein PGTUg99_017666 [Puccinia graminis f. sp. tritici]KAA1084705.1 hypothetical protein PGT21_034501 [Puccinia graminis f. sp. tritici]
MPHQTGAYNVLGSFMDKRVKDDIPKNKPDPLRRDNKEDQAYAHIALIELVISATDGPAAESDKEAPSPTKWFFVEESSWADPRSIPTVEQQSYSQAGTPFWCGTASSHSGVELYCAFRFEMKSRSKTSNCHSHTNLTLRTAQHQNRQQPPPVYQSFSSRNNINNK